MISKTMFRFGLYARKLLALNYTLSFIYLISTKIIFFRREKSSNRKKTSLFDYLLLSKPCKNNSVSVIRDNNLYGIEEVFSRFTNKKIKNCFFEHGIFLGNLITFNTKHTFAKKIITYGDYRYEILKKGTNKQIEPVGPFIHYVDSLIPEDEELKLKKELGKVLLVFPSHSTSASKINYDVDNLCLKIEEIKKEYNTILICLYWKDIILGRGQDYEKKGYKITCAGYYKDSFFLNRLKTIINLADSVIANDVGTFIGYCIYFNKPVYLFKQETTLTGLNNRFKFTLSQRNIDETEKYENIREKLFETFNGYSNIISMSQYQLCSYIWGYNYIKTKQQLISIL